MIVIHGSGFYGKVDQVKGLFHVVTLFQHVYWIPLFPTKSYLILKGGAGNPGATIPIKLRGKSILFAYLRLVVVCTTLLCLPAVIGIPVEALTNGWRRDHVGVWLAFTLALGVAVALFALSYRWARAKPERALELAALAGIDPTTLAHYFAEHITSEDEDRLRNLVAEQVDLQNSP